MDNFDPGLLFWSLATFAGLMFLLSKFAFKPLRHLLSQREASIQNAVDEAKAARDAAQKLIEQHRAELDQARSEARSIIDEGSRLAASQRKEAEQRAKEQANQIIDQARSEIERETVKSLDELKNTLANLSIRISRQIIRENLDEKRHAELADQFIERLKKTRDANTKQ
jgi:F-type H+-transporting ATPase subunit b